MNVAVIFWSRSDFIASVSPVQKCMGVNASVILYWVRVGIQVLPSLWGQYKNALATIRQRRTRCDSAHVIDFVWAPKKVCEIAPFRHFGALETERRKGCGWCLYTYLLSSTPHESPHQSAVIASHTHHDVLVSHPDVCKIAPFRHFAPWRCEMDACLLLFEQPPYTARNTALFAVVCREARCVTCII